MTKCILIGAPVDSGKRTRGCLMGPDAYRTAGLAEALRDLGHGVEDLGNLTPASHGPDDGGGPLFRPRETIGWTHRLIRAAGRPYPGAFTHRGDSKLTIWRAKPVAGAELSSSSASRDSP